MAPREELRYVIVVEHTRDDGHVFSCGVYGCWATIEEAEEAACAELDKCSEPAFDADGKWVAWVAHVWSGYYERLPDGKPVSGMTWAEHTARGLYFCVRDEVSMLAQAVPPAYASGA